MIGIKRYSILASSAGHSPYFSVCLIFSVDLYCVLRINLQNGNKPPILDPGFTRRGLSNCPCPSVSLCVCPSLNISETAH